MKRWKEDGDHGRWSKQLIEKTIYVGDYFITEDGRKRLGSTLCFVNKNLSNNNLKNVKINKSESIIFLTDLY